MVHEVPTTLGATRSEAIVRQMLTANPCRGVTRDVVKPERRKMVVLTPAEVHALADAVGAKHPPYRTLILTAAFTEDGCLNRAVELAKPSRRPLGLANLATAGESARSSFGSMPARPSPQPRRNPQPLRQRYEPQANDGAATVGFGPGFSATGLSDRPRIGRVLYDAAAVDTAPKPAI